MSTRTHNPAKPKRVPRTIHAFFDKNMEVVRAIGETKRKRLGLLPGTVYILPPSSPSNREAELERAVVRTSMKGLRYASIPRLKEWTGQNWSEHFRACARLELFRRSKSKRRGR